MSDELNNRYAEQTAIRTRLTELGLSATLAEIDWMKQFHSMDTITRMLDTAHENWRAMAFLKIVLRKIRQALSKPSDVKLDAQSARVVIGNERPAHFPVPKLPPFSKFPILGGHRPTLRREPDIFGPVLATVPRTASLHIYGKQAALTIEAGQSPKDAPVVFVEAAAAKGETGYDWDSKIRLMLTFSEMLHTLAVFLNHLPCTAGKNHGPDRDKWFEIEHQARHVFMKIGQGKIVRAVRIDSEDAFRFAALLSAQIRQNVPAGAQADIHLLLRHIVAPMATLACA